MMKQFSRKNFINIENSFKNFLLRRKQYETDYTTQGVIQSMLQEMARRGRAHGEVSLESKVQNSESVIVALDLLKHYSLDRLNLANNQLNDNSVGFLTLYLPRINVLNLANNNITDNGISYLVDLINQKGLRGVNLKGNPISDKGVIALFQAGARAGVNPDNIIIDRDHLSISTHQRIQALTQKAHAAQQSSLRYYNSIAIVSAIVMIASMFAGFTIISVAATSAAITLGLALYFGSLLLTPISTSYCKQRISELKEKFSPTRFSAVKQASAEHRAMMTAFKNGVKQYALPTQQFSTTHAEDSYVHVTNSMHSSQDWVTSAPPREEVSETVEVSQFDYQPAPYIPPVNSQFYGNQQGMFAENVYQYSPPVNVGRGGSVDFVGNAYPYGNNPHQYANRYNMFNTPQYYNANPSVFNPAMAGYGQPVSNNQFVPNMQS